MARSKQVFLLIPIIIIFLATNVFGQELNAVVSISTPKLQSTDPKVFTTLQKDLQEFLNNEEWTDDDYKDHERIDCNFQINITDELDNTTFKADIAVKAIRPVYGSEYKTILINYVDRDVIFNYQEYSPIENGTDNFRSNLSAVFCFYTHLILGLDAESFASGSGDVEFQKAQQIINQVPSQISEVDKGWLSLSRKTTRYWIMENLLNPRFTSFNEAWYNYHRKSLDIMYQNPSQALVTMLDALKEVDKTNTAYPNSVGVLMFVTAKSEEIIDIFKNADRTQKNTVYDIMRKLDPSNSGKYNVIRG